MSISTLSYQTGGLYPNGSNYAPLLTGGAPILLNPTPALNPNEDPTKQGLTSSLNLDAQQLADLQSIATLKNPSGNIVVPSQSGFISMGSGYQLNFDETTLQGRITPALNPSEINGANSYLESVGQTFTGSDVRLMIESAEQPAGSTRYYKQLLEATTISVSIHREVAPVRAGGYINPKGFALGKRTIAGSLIVTQFTADVLMSFLQGIMMNDTSKDSTFTKVDQLPPFNITMIFTNEYGYASQRTLLGVKFVTDGVVYSIQDMLVEQTISWMATDFTPLLPLNFNNLFQPVNASDPTTVKERSPMDLMKQVS